MILYQRFCEKLEGLCAVSFSAAVGVDRKTLRRWEGSEGRLEDRPSRPGSAPHTTGLLPFIALVGAYQHYHGEIGGRTMETLTGVPHATADRIVSAWREKRPEAIVEPRTKVTILAPGVLYSSDGTPLKAGYGLTVHLFPVMDEASAYRLALLLLPQPSEEAIERLLEEVFIEDGPPLAFKADHGSEYFHSKRFHTFLESWNVLALPNPGHYPKFNGRKEHGHWEFECHVRRTPGWPFLTKVEARQTFGRVMMLLNHEFPRPILGGKTSGNVFRQIPRPRIDRTELRQEVEAWGRKIHEVYPDLKGGEPAYERRAISCALLRHRLIKIEGPKLSPFFDTLLGQRL